MADVAAAYACTPANIYAILAKLRRQDTPASGSAAPLNTTAALVASPLPVVNAAEDLFEAPQEPPRTAPVAIAGPPAARPVAKKAGEVALEQIATPSGPSSGRDALAAARPDRLATTPKSAPSSPKVQAHKPGYALLMRSSEGEETVNPFRSLDELLSAAKPILRTAPHRSA